MAAISSALVVINAGGRRAGGKGRSLILAAQRNMLRASVASLWVDTVGGTDALLPAVLDARA